MDVLCTDKTGTSPRQDRARKASRRARRSSEKVLQYGYLNSFHHTGLKNLLDEAILDHKELREHLKADEKYRKIDEIPFDFVRRRMSVVVEDDTGLNTLICKGAVEEVLSQCTGWKSKGGHPSPARARCQTQAVGRRSERSGLPGHRPGLQANAGRLG